VFSLAFGVLGLFGVVSTNANSTNIGIPKETNGLYLYTNFDSYYRQEKIIIGLRNRTQSSREVSPQPWKITNSRGQTVKTGRAPAQKIVLQPGQSVEWKWDQKTFTQQLASPGNYTIKLRNLYDARFNIKTEMGSSGAFTFTHIRHSESFGVFLNNPQAVRHAIENFYNLNSKHVNGKLVDDRPGKSPFDSQWSWHLDPNETGMADISTEVCDGWPSAVESNLDGWMHVGRFCPWSTKVTKLDS